MKIYLTNGDVVHKHINEPLTGLQAKRIELTFNEWFEVNQKKEVYACDFFNHLRTRFSPESGEIRFVHKYTNDESQGELCGFHNFQPRYDTYNKEIIYRCDICTQCGKII